MSSNFENLSVFLAIAVKLFIAWSVEINLTEINFSPGAKQYDLNIFKSFSNSNILSFKSLLFKFCSNNFILLFNFSNFIFSSLIILSFSLSFTSNSFI